MTAVPVLVLVFVDSNSPHSYIARAKLVRCPRSLLKVTS